MKQLTILCSQSAAGCGGLPEILKEHEIVGITSWKATTYYEDVRHEHEEVRQGECQHLSMIVPDEKCERLTNSLLGFNERLPSGQRLIFWFTDVVGLHVPWQLAS